MKVVYNPKAPTEGGALQKRDYKQKVPKDSVEEQDPSPARCFSVAARWVLFGASFDVWIRQCQFGGLRGGI